MARLVETAWTLADEPTLGPLRLRAHAHTFGFRGHFATKSRAYSTTFGALRAARAAYRRSRSEPPGADPHDVEAVWHYAGRGYRTPQASRLAEALADAGRGLPRGSRPVSPPTSPDLPNGSDQG